MTHNKYNTTDIEIKRKNRISLKRSRSVVSMNSNKSNTISTSTLSKQLSLKRKRRNLESISFKYDDESSKNLNGNLTSLEVHDSKGNIVTDNESINKTDVSHIHFGSNCESKSSMNGSSGLTIDLSKNNYIPSAKPPKTPSTKSPVLEDWESYSFLPSGSSNAGSTVTVNSMPHSVSDSISSFVKRIPAVIRSGKSTNSSSLSDKSYCDFYDKDSCIVDDVVHAHRNKLQVKLNRVITHSNKRWSNIFQKRTQLESEKEFTASGTSSLALPEKDKRFKIPARIHHSSDVEKNPAVQSLIKSDCDILPQKILVPDFKEKNQTQLPGLPSNCGKPNIHYVKRVTKQAKAIGFVEKSNQTAYLAHKEQIFSPNSDLKDSANSPNYPGYIPGFSSLSIKDLLQDANSKD